MRDNGKSIRLSPKHGVNPSVVVCFWCGEDRGEIALLGRLPDDREAPHRIITGYEPCEKCRKNMALGVVLAEVSTSEVIPGLPAIDPEKELYPTGRWVVLKEEAVEKVFDAGAAANLREHRRGYVDRELFNLLQPE